MSDNKKAYRLKIIERAKWRIENDPHFRLSEINRSAITRQVFNMVCTYDLSEEPDQRIIREYFGIGVIETSLLIKKAEDKKEAMGKAVFQLLSEQTHNPQDRLLDFTALFVGLKERPYSKKINYHSLNVEGVKKPHKKQQKREFLNINYTATLFSIMGIVVIGIVATVIFALSINNPNTQKFTQPHITINAKDIIVSDLNRIFPDSSTDFFDEDNKPKIWYADYNSTREYYNMEGIHPKTKTPLQPVTQQVVKTVFVEHQKIESTSKKPYLLNTSLKNNPHKEQVSIIIVDSTYTEDELISDRVKEVYLDKGYHITTPLILQSNLSKDVIRQLTALNNEFFKTDLLNHTDYLCIGNVDYDFRKNSILADRVTCEITLSLSLISVETGVTKNSFTKTTYGYGKTKQQAVTNTIKKISYETILP